MNNKNNFKNFIGVSTVTRTIRNELVPTEITKENIEKTKVLKADEKRHENRQQLKPVLDDYFRQFISKKLSKVDDIDWVPAFELMEEAAKRNDDADRKNKLKEDVIKIQKSVREAIVKHFTSDENYKRMLQPGEMVKKMLPDFIKKHEEYSKEERERYNALVDEFDGFTTSLTKLFKTRENMFSTEAKSTGIANRIVNDNMVIFMTNKKYFEKVVNNVDGETLDKLRNDFDTIAGEISLDMVYSYDSYNRFITQEGIDAYNDICGKVNSFLNEYYQKHKDCKGKVKMKNLYKQILCKSESMYSVPEVFTSDEEVYSSINSFLDIISKKDVFNRVINLGVNIDSYNLDKIYVVNKSFGEVSNRIYDNWDVIRTGLYARAEKKIPGKDTKTRRKKIETAVKSVVHLSMKEINDMVKNYNLTDKPDAKVENYIVSGVEILDIEHLTYVPSVNLVGNEDKIEEIKTTLDKIVSISRWCKIFMTNDAEEIVDKDIDFYSELESIFDTISEIDVLYNRVRNYVTKKPYSKDKIKLYFGSSTLASGWSKNKIFDSNAVLMEKDGFYYIGILNKDNKPSRNTFSRTLQRNNDYKCLSCTFWNNVVRMIPHVFMSPTGKDTYHPSDELVKAYEDDLAYKKNKGGKPYTQEMTWKTIDYYKDCLKQYKDWSRLNLVSKSTEEYSTIKEFADDIEPQMYVVEWTYISPEEIDKLQKDGQLYLFRINNKDLSKSSTGKKNLHTLYFENLFSKENLKDVVFKLSGGAELFYRPGSIKEPIAHKKGSVLVNKTYEVEENGQTVKKFVPDKIYVEIYRKFNGINPAPLSYEAEKLVNSGVIKTRVATTDIVKDNRYTDDKYFINMAIDINYGAKKAKAFDFNQEMIRYIAKSDDLHIIGIDRGERNLLYVSVIDTKGNIVEQKSFNIIDGYDYQDKLHTIENGRQNARKEWKTISKIKDVKAGYLSLVIHKISEMVIEYNAIIVMEDLNDGFKSKRSKVERSVYQKFETMLINKFSYLSFKDRDKLSDGGILRGYQLAPMKKPKDKKTQYGAIFYVPAAYTSKIDPTTGFSDIFTFKNILAEDRADFIEKFDSITYDTDRDMFKFSYDYKNFKTHNVDMAKTRWDVYTNGTRIVRVRKNGRFTGESDEIDVTARMKDILSRADDINWQDGHDLRDDIIRYGFESAVINILKLALQLRNSKSEYEDRDYDKIVSPVLNSDGKFFDSSIAGDNLPNDADANGAYNIALKGLYKVLKIKENWVDGEKLSDAKLNISNKNWFDFIQYKRY